MVEYSFNEGVYVCKYVCKYVCCVCVRVCACVCVCLLGLGINAHQLRKSLTLNPCSPSKSESCLAFSASLTSCRLSFCTMEQDR